MRTIDRALLMVFAFTFVVFSALMLAVSFGWLYPLYYTINMINSPFGRLVLIIVFSLLLLAGLRLFTLTVNRHAFKHALVQQTPYGKVRVSLVAIENLIKKAVRQIKGVRDVKALVTSRENNGILVQVKLIVNPEVSIPTISVEIQQTIKDYVMDVVGIEVSDINIGIENISSDGKSRIE